MQEEAEISGRIASYENETFYFSSDECKREFEKEPEKYVRKEQTEKKKEDHAAMPEINRTWADLLKPRQRQPEHEGGRCGIQRRRRRTALGKYPTTPEVIDWNGPDKEGAPPPKWSKGWGGFPGAKYLGIKREDKRRILRAIGRDRRGRG